MHRLYDQGLSIAAIADEGQRITARELWETAQNQGYTKSVSTVERWIHQCRGAVSPGRRAVAAESDLLPKRATWKPCWRRGADWPNLAEPHKIGNHSIALCNLGSPLLT